MFKPKDKPVITHDVVITDNIYVVAGVLTMKDDNHHFIFEDNAWKIRVANGSFVKLGNGACPNFTVDKRIDADCFDDIFEEVEE